MRPTGPVTPPRDRDELIEDLQTDERQAGARLAERVAELERAIPQLPPQPPASPSRAGSDGGRSPWVAGLAIVAALAGGALLGHSVTSGGAQSSATSATHDHGAPSAAAVFANPNYHPARRGKVEIYKRPDPTLPAVPAGPVKRFRVDVNNRLTRVAPDGKSFDVWSFGVNGKFLSGTGGSPPMVVNEGDTVEVQFHNGFDHAMRVQLPHSLDFHAAVGDPTTDFPTINPGATHTIRFKATHPGVYMYHCVSAPALLHVGSGMAGMFVVKPKNQPKVDKEFWIVQQEFYAPDQGADPDYQKMLDNKPTTIAFNGYANQYADHPISVKKGDKIRLYFLNGGAQRWSAFHVVGGLFDKTYEEGVVGHDAQTVSFAPSQGGYMEMSFPKEGSYVMVSHAFGDVGLGAVGAFRTTHAHGAVMQH